MKIDEILSGLSPEEKLERLNELAVKKEKTTYSRTLTAEELAAEEKAFSRMSIERKRLKDEAKEVAESYKNKINELDGKLDENLERINNKKRQVPGILYLIPDRSEGKMLMVEEGGELIDERDLKPEEKQLNAFADSHTSENPEGTEKIENPLTPGSEANFSKDSKTGKKIAGSKKGGKKLKSEESPVMAEEVVVKPEGDKLSEKPAAKKRVRKPKAETKKEPESGSGEE